MIVIGYPGIGKSQLAKTSSIYFDFDSSIVNKSDGWEYRYFLEAENYSSQGKIVFVSAHKQVQDYLKDSAEKVAVVYPSLLLHDYWVDKLRDRHFFDPSPENWRALQRVVSHYAEDIVELDSSPFIKIKLESEDYNLESLLTKELKS